MPYVLLKANDKQMNLFLRGDEVDNLLWASSTDDRFVLQDTGTHAIIKMRGRLSGKSKLKMTAENPVLRRTVRVKRFPKGGTHGQVRRRLRSGARGGLYYLRKGRRVYVR